MSNFPITVICSQAPVILVLGNLVPSSGPLRHLHTQGVHLLIKVHTFKVVNFSVDLCRSCLLYLGLVSEHLKEWEELQSNAEMALLQLQCTFIHE